MSSTNHAWEAEEEKASAGLITAFLFPISHLHPCILKLRSLGTRLEQNRISKESCQRPFGWDRRGYRKHSTKGGFKFIAHCLQLNVKFTEREPINGVDQSPIDWGFLRANHLFFR